VALDQDGIILPEKPPFYRDLRIIKWIAQLAALGVVAFVGWLLATQLQHNLAIQGKEISFVFLSKPVGITLSDGFNTTPTSGMQALAVGITNTLRVTASGIIAAILLGTLLGVARLSDNWIVSRASTIYVETIRNIPVLVQIVFWQVLLRGLGPLTLESGIFNVGDKAVFYASAKGLSFPWFNPTDTRWQWVVIFAIGIYAAKRVYAWRIGVQEAGTGEARVGTWVLLSLAVAGIIGWYAHALTGFMHHVFLFTAGLFETVPIIVYQLLISAIVAYVAYRVVRARLNLLETPNGYGKFSDDDWYRIIAASIVGLLVVILFMTQAGISAAIAGQEDVAGTFMGFQQLFEIFASKFGPGLADSSIPPFDPNLPVLSEGTFANMVGGVGKVFTIQFFALWLGLVVYTAVFIGEAVRAGVLAVAKGQSEAGLAVGLRRGQLLRMIVLPQAFRIVLPPIGNQFLNLFKNSSLAIAVGFSDIVQVGQTVFNQTGQSIPIFLVWMLFYSIGSLSLSSIVNYYNRKLALVER
jgi:His/Glu/Gln/Arg/opine family amino acid ABC transporter permease subunit